MVDGEVRLLAPDDVIPAGLRTSALVRARIVDELTLQPVTRPAAVTPAGAAFDSPQARAAVNPRAATGGLVGLVGVAARALPSLRVVAYDVGIRVSAAGYLPAMATLSIGPQAQFPGQFAPVLLPDLLLHRAPVVLSGRTVVQGLTTTLPLPGAVISISGIWRTAPTQVLAPPALPPNIVAVHPPLYAAQAAATATLRQVTPVPDLLNDKRLLRAAPAGLRELALSNRVAIAVGDVLTLDGADPWRSESLVIAAINGATSPTDAAVVTLAHALRAGHRRDALVQRTDITAPGANETLALDAITGDTTLMVSNAVAFATGTIEVVDGGAAPQYHRLSTYTATSDADGYWSLPPLSRVAQVELRATHGAHPTITRAVVPEYPRREQRADFVFT